jgi:hypothetical protein
MVPPQPNSKRRTLILRLESLFCLFGRLLLVAAILFLVNLYQLMASSSSSLSYQQYMMSSSDSNHQNAAMDMMLSETRRGNAVAAVTVDPCLVEYQRVTENRTEGLTVEDLERSRAYVGNRHRLGLFASKLVAAQRQPVNVIVCGGSISLGHGVTPVESRYSDVLQVWLNDKYPLSNPAGKHRVFNMGSHGADVRDSLLDFVCD